MRRLYQSLPYILLKKKYLVPSPPKRPHFPTLSFKTNPYGMLQKYYPQALDPHVQDMFKAGKNA